MIISGPKVCPSFDPLPKLLHGDVDTGAIDGNISTFQCSFEADYGAFVSATVQYWTIKEASYAHKIIRVNETSRFAEYSVTVYSDCLANDEPCCRVTSQLKISNSSTVLNNSLITCYVELALNDGALNDGVNINSSAHLSELLYMYDVVIVPYSYVVM